MEPEPYGFRDHWNRLSIWQRTAIYIVGTPAVAFAFLVYAALILGAF